MHKGLSMLAVAGLAVAVAVQPGMARQDGPGVLEVGEMAPDFELTGATRYGVLRDAVRLSDFRGKTVVLAFFFRVRTRG